jgi:beta-lactamase class A
MHGKYGHRSRRFWVMLGVGLIVALVVIFVVARQPNTPSGQPAVNDEQSAVEPTSHVDEELTRQIAAWADAQPANYGIVVRELGGDERTAEYQADRSMTTASTYKVFLVYAFLHAVEQGDAVFDEQLPIGYSAEACIDRLLLRSENDCAYDLGNTVGWDSIDLLLPQYDYVATSLNNYDANGQTTNADKKSSARDEALLMERLASGTLLDAGHTEMMLSRLKQQIWRERVPAGVPDGVVVADKPGWLDGVQNDAAIVYGSKGTYVITIMSDGSPTAPLAQLSTLVYDYLQK